MEVKMSPGPFWKHDGCRDCKYLDSVELSVNTIHESKYFDLYHHRGDREHTVVVRFGDNPEDYSSGIGFRDMNPLIAMACIMAKIPRTCRD